MKKYLCKGDQVLFETNAKTLPRGGEHFFLTADSSIKNPMIVDGEIIEDPTEILTQQIKSLYEAMVVDVYNEMENVFGTNNDASAQAYAATWEAMKIRPLNYVDIELGFTDEASVVAYAEGKLNNADAYGVFRMKRIAKYQVDKSTVLNP